jgi:hypothetical protein
VLYLLDGQDTLMALSSPENETLEADEWVLRLSGEKLMPELILVAVCHGEGFGQRDTELSPQVDGPKMADFIVNDVKHFIDYIFCRDRVLGGREHTGFSGSAWAHHSHSIARHVISTRLVVWAACRRSLRTSAWIRLKTAH